jgi:hypothetical protein
MKFRRYGQKILPQEFAVALPYVERREALGGGTSNEVNTVDLVHTRARLALDLISTLAGIFERAEDIKPD